MEIDVSQAKNFLIIVLDIYYKVELLVDPHNHHLPKRILFLRHVNHYYWAHSTQIFGGTLKTFFLHITEYCNESELFVTFISAQFSKIFGLYVPTIIYHIYHQLAAKLYYGLLWLFIKSFVICRIIRTKSTSSVLQLGSFRALRSFVWAHAHNMTRFLQTIFNDNVKRINSIVQERISSNSSYTPLTNIWVGY